MGMGEELMEEIAFDDFVKEVWIDDMIEKKYWIQANGERIKIKKMSTSHLHNTINYLEKLNDYDMHIDLIALMKKRLKKRMRE